MTLRVSVIVAQAGSLQSLGTAAATAIRALQPERDELLLVGVDAEACAEGLRRTGAPSTIIRAIVAPQTTLVPVLWATGIAAAAGEWIATTTDEFRPAPDWCDQLLQSAGATYVGVGGAIRLGPDASRATAAAYLLRYVKEAPWHPQSVVRDIAADSAIYRRADVLAASVPLARGFWEWEWHRSFERSGHRLLFSPAAVSDFVGPISVRRFLRQRFVHGRDFGATRANGRLAARLRLLVAAPIVPAVIALRAVRLAVGQSGWPGSRLLATLPMLLLFASAWAVGEAVGALQPAPRAS